MNYAIKIDLPINIIKIRQDFRNLIGKVRRVTPYDVFLDFSQGVIQGVLKRTLSSLSNSSAPRWMSSFTITSKINCRGRWCAGSHPITTFFGFFVGCGLGCAHAHLIEFFLIQSRLAQYPSSEQAQLLAALARAINNGNVQIAATP